MKANSQLVNRAAALAATLLCLSLNFSACAKDPAAPDDRAAATMQVTGSVPVKAAGPYVQVGSYRIWVSSHLGKPSITLPDGTWLYKEFSVDDSRVEGTLVVGFKNGRVNELKLVSPAVEAAMCAPTKPSAIIADSGRH